MLQLTYTSCDCLSELWSLATPGAQRASRFSEFASFCNTLVAELVLVIHARYVPLRLTRGETDTRVLMVREKLMAGGLVITNQICNQDPKDGTVIGDHQESTVHAPRWFTVCSAIVSDYCDWAIRRA